MKQILLNQKQAAEALGISTRTIARSDLQPVKIEGSNKLYPLDQLIDFEAERRSVEIAISDIKTDLEPGTVQYATWRKTMAQAVGQELKNEIAQGEVVPVDFVSFTLGPVMNEAAGILDSLPLQVARKCPEATPKILDVIKREIAKAMNAISTINTTSLPGIIEEYMEQNG